MNFNQTKVLFIILFIFSALSTRAEDFRIYSVIRGSRLFITNYDVSEFVKLSTLSDSALINLFNQNNKDYNAYSQALSKYTKAHFNDAVLKLGYIKMVEMYATRSKDHSTWKAFKITQRDYQKEIEQREDKALKDLLDEGKGIRYARDKFGAQLKEAGFPHYEGRTNTDIYFDWYELQKKRIKLDFLLKEVSRFEYVSASKPKFDKYLLPRKVYDFADEVTLLAEQKLTDKRMTAREAQELLAADPRLSVMIEELDFLSPDSTNMKTLLESAPAVYEDFVKSINSEIIPALSTSVPANIIRYASIAQKFSTEYNEQELKDKAQESQNNFITNKGSYNNLVLSKLYELALEAQRARATKSSTLNDAEIEAYAKKVSNVATELLSDSAFINSQDAKTLRLEDWLLKELVEQTAARDGDDLYKRKFESLARWVVKFQVKKAALNTTPQTLLSLRDKKQWETLKRVEKYVDRVEYDKSLADFKKRELLNYFDGIITLNLTGDNEQSHREALVPFFK